MIGFCPWSELASLNCCVTAPLLICSFMYFGTATWKAKPVIGAPCALANDASTIVMLALLGSLAHEKLIVSPFLLYAWKGVGPPPPPPMLMPPIIASRPPAPGGGAAGAGA